MNSQVGVSKDVQVELLSQLRQVVETALEGKEEVVGLALTALLARGHILLEDVPGVGKTTLARALAKAVGGNMNRVQFTSDMLPSDVLGVTVYEQENSSFTLRKGAVFSNVLLADEINRASPRTQSALLESMNEGQVSVDGVTHDLPQPFFVVATQNPQDFAGTFPLPESQLDRFMMRVEIGYPSPEVETRLMLHPQGDRIEGVSQVLNPETLAHLQLAVEKIQVDPEVGKYLQTLISATRKSSVLSIGASTRAGMSLARAARARALLEGRDYCLPDDIYTLAIPLLAHRVRLTAHADGYMPSREESERAIADIMRKIPSPL
ncbi:MAG: AAA family ATPase [Polyangiaceae bacterium]|nr:AAA family ATPase [Polyangiaceae bacterium]